LYNYQNDVTSDVRAYLTSTTTWSESSVNFLSEPGRGTVYEAATVSGPGWVSWDLTTFANDVAGGTLSLALHSTSSGFKYFRSDEYADANFRPYLDVTPTAPVPEPATLLLFCSGLAGFFGLRKRFKR